MFSDTEYTCVAIPDPGFGYGVGCSPVADATKHGVAVALIDPRTSGAATIAVALPANGRLEAERSNKARLPLASKNGVVATRLNGHRAVISETPSGSRRLELPTPRELDIKVDCERLPSRPPADSDVSCR